MLKALVIGSVGSTALTLRKLVEHGFDVAGVLGYEPENKARVSGWTDLRSLAGQLNVEFRPFLKINDEAHLEWAASKQVDVIFAVGFSQLLAERWLKMPRLGCIGFHPTHLPSGRGRAPLAWIILEERRGAANFFLMGEGADDGPVFVQSAFTLGEQDDASSVRDLLQVHIARALDEWLPRLAAGEWAPQPQDDAHASYYGKRNPEDGLINWTNSAQQIDLLIKASTDPHPGAFTYLKDQKLVIWHAHVEKDLRIKGVTGRVLLTRMDGADMQYLVQCGSGLLWIHGLDPAGTALKVGDQLGYQPELEIARLRNELKQLKQQIELLQTKTGYENTGDSTPS